MLTLVSVVSIARTSLDKTKYREALLQDLETIRQQPTECSTSEGDYPQSRGIKKKTGKLKVLIPTGINLYKELPSSI
jgi:hypothetical protein